MLAAIVRNPSNIAQIKSDLFEICQHILRQANAQNQDANLIKKAEQTKVSIFDMREEVEIFLRTRVPKISIGISGMELEKAKSGKISAIQEINKEIALKYKIIMHDLSQFCQDVMGKPPCDYAVVGMGSLAREEITPYSDFEHIILLFDNNNYEIHLEYFRWYTVIFHVIVLNIQESIIPSLNIRSLNDKNSRLKDWYYDAITPRGVSFDGMMSHACKFPLGRQSFTKLKKFTTELIKPVSKMLQYLSSKADLKNGYHLADILTKTCYVFGNEDIFKQFESGAQIYRDRRSEKDVIDEIMAQVKDDLNQFSTRFRLTKLNSQHTINIKQFVYRSTTIFIAALARKFNVLANSCFGIVEEMAQNNNITQNAAKKLQYAIAIACEVRLRVYSKKKSQCDNAIDLKQSDIWEFLNIVGVASTVNYFQIAYCLQCEVAKQLHFTKFHFYSDPQLINITLGLAFGMGDFTSFSSNLYHLAWNLRSFNFDRCIKLIETKTNLCIAPFQKLNESNYENTSKLCKNNAVRLQKLNTKQLKVIAQYLETAAVYDEALEFYNQLLDIVLNKSDSTSNEYDVACTNHGIGTCLRFLNRPKEALIYLNRALNIKQTNRIADNCKSLVLTLHCIGSCHIALDEFDEALKYLYQILKIEQQEMLHNNHHQFIGLAVTYHAIGDCYTAMQRYDEALKNLNHAYRITQSASPNADNSQSFAVILLSIGRCYTFLQHYNKAMEYLRRALGIKYNLTLNPNDDRGIAEIFQYIGDCHIGMQQYDKALKNLKRALEIERNTTLNNETDCNLAHTLYAFGRCFKEMHQFDNALEYLNRALKIQENVTSNGGVDRDIAATLQCIGDCYTNRQEYSKALEYQNRAIGIKQNTTLAADSDRSLAVSFQSIGRCYMSLEQYDDALKNFKRALDIKLITTRNFDNDKDLAVTLHSLGDCHTFILEYNDALNYLKRALKIEQNTTHCARVDTNIAVILHSIGHCYIGMEKYDDALNNLRQALEIEQNITLDVKKSRGFAITQRDIGRCLLGLEQYDESWNCLEKSLKVLQVTSQNKENDYSIAHTLIYMGECLMRKLQYTEALTHFHLALKIYQTKAISETNRYIAIAHFNIAFCFVELQEYADAMDFLKKSLEHYEKLPSNEHIASKILSIRSEIHTCLLKIN